MKRALGLILLLSPPLAFCIALGVFEGWRELLKFLAIFLSLLLLAGVMALGMILISKK